MWLEAEWRNHSTWKTDDNPHRPHRHQPSRALKKSATQFQAANGHEKLSMLQQGKPQKFHLLTPILNPRNTNKTMRRNTNKTEKIMCDPTRALKAPSRCDMTKGSTTRALDVSHWRGGEMVLVTSQFSHNPSVSLATNNKVKNLKLTGVEHACSLLWIECSDHLLSYESLMPPHGRRTGGIVKRHSSETNQQSSDK